MEWLHDYRGTVRAVIIRKLNFIDLNDVFGATWLKKGRKKILSCLVLGKRALGKKAEDQKNIRAIKHRSRAVINHENGLTGKQECTGRKKNKKCSNFVKKKKIRTYTSMELEIDNCGVSTAGTTYMVLQGIFPLFIHVNKDLWLLL